MSEIDEAEAVLQAAVDAQRQYELARAHCDTARDELHEAIREQLAAGTSVTELARLTGYTKGRISQIRHERERLHRIGPRSCA